MTNYRYHQYQVVGRGLPTESDPHPKIYRMKLWARDEVRAKSKFWYFLRKLRRVKKANGQVLAINEGDAGHVKGSYNILDACDFNVRMIFEKDPTTIKNFGIWLRYQSRTGYANMYKEYRDTTLNGAVEQMYDEMASRHRVRSPCIQIIRTSTLTDEQCKRENVMQFLAENLRFPLPSHKIRASSRGRKTTFKARRPTTFL